MNHNWVDGARVSKSLKGVKVCAECKTILRPDKSNEHRECEARRAPQPVK